MFFARRPALFGLVIVAWSFVLSIVSLLSVSFLLSPAAPGWVSEARVSMIVCFAILMALIVTILVLWVQEYAYFWKARNLMLDMYVATARSEDSAEKIAKITKMLPRAPNGWWKLSRVNRQSMGGLRLVFVTVEGDTVIRYTFESYDNGIQLNVARRATDNFMLGLDSDFSWENVNTFGHRAASMHLLRMARR